jgi:23S rRNA (uracil1939-C5)-methyltransferase
MTRFSTILQCDYFPLCSGCEIHGDVSSPQVWTEVKNFFEKIGVPISLIVGQATHWRSRAKLAVRGTAHHPEIGLFKHGSHQVVSIPTCPLHHPSINRVCAHVKQSLIDLNIEPYQEERGAGVVRYLQFVVEDKTGQVQLTLVVNKSDPQLERCVKRLYAQGGIHSIWLNFQTEKTNTIFGEKWELCAGEPYLWEHIGNQVCAFHPACFGQANKDLFMQALNRIREWVKPHQSIVEFYAGVGVIGLNLAPQSKEIACVEINPYASECFHLSRFKLAHEAQRKISMKISSTEQALPLIAGRDVIIADPPRKGLDPELLNALCRAPQARQFVYLSCGPNSFQRDSEKLLQHGWKVDNAEAYLFFPGANHVEILCSFKRSG